MSEGFLMDAWTALVFYRYCRMYGITGYEDKLRVIRELERRGKVKHLRSVEQFIDGKSALRIQNKGDNSAFN